MTAVDDILAQIPMSQLAARLGVDERTAEQATRSALPALLGGMQANAQDPRGAASLERAVTQHDPSLVEGGVDLDQVDTADGDKIVTNVFGDNRGQVEGQLSQFGGLGGLLGGGGSAGGGAAGGAGGLVGKLLPILAPIVLSYLAKQMSGGRPGQAQAGGAGAGAGAGAGGLGDLLGGLLGGAAPGGAGGMGGLGDLLGGLLGGGKR